MNGNDYNPFDQDEEVKTDVSVDVDTTDSDTTDVQDDDQDSQPELVQDTEEDPRPSYDSLMAKFPKKWNESDNTHQQDWGVECKKWAERNKYHFLGFCLESKEPLFKKMK